MASIITKKIKGRDYLYLVESIRLGEKVSQKTIKYIGPKRPISREEFDCMVFSHSAKDWILNETNDQLSYIEHEKMKKASVKRKKYLQGLDAISRENEREKFLSIFIAHSNAIEGSTMSIKDTFNYLFKDIVPESKKKKELFMASNLLEAWDYLEKNYTDFPTSEHLTKLHQLVNIHIEDEETLGKYKEVQNYIGDVYTSSYLFVGKKMTQLLRWISKAYCIVNDFEVAFQSHAQFEIIHPFVDGNGRVGRLLLNWLLLHQGLAPLAMRAERRSAYISALENARRGKIEAISRFCYGEYMEQYQFVE